MSYRVMILENPKIGVAHTRINSFKMLDMVIGVKKRCLAFTYIRMSPIDKYKAPITARPGAKKESSIGIALAKTNRMFVFRMNVSWDIGFNAFDEFLALNHI
ncbi:hypothetical protein V6259_12540 [Marinomonas sp. TI.3.20]|uniref:hypothetical protein n=1 Tax=Marinomonas sp. TI.3.20 TaxID=3121296 RepID=UPI0031202916